MPEMLSYNPCCICSIYPCQTPGVCPTSKVLGKGEGGQPLYLSHTQFLSTIKSNIVLSDRLSCYGSRHLNERQDFGIQFSVVSVSNNGFSIHLIPFDRVLRIPVLLCVLKARFTSSLFLADHIFWSLPHTLPLTIHPWIRQHELGKINYFVKWSLFFGSGGRAVGFLVMLVSVFLFG